MSEIKASGKKIVLTVHNNELLCYKGTMAYKNNCFCKDNSSFSRCISCLSDRHKFGPVIYLLNLMNQFLKISESKKLNYDRLLQNFSEQTKYIISQMDFIVVLDNWVLDFFPFSSNHKIKTICIPQSVQPSIISKKTSKTDHLANKKLVYLGRTDLTKGLLLLVRAINNLVGISLDCYIDITDEEYFNQVKKEVEKNKLSVKFFPLLDHTIMFEKLIEYDLLCMPTFSEMSPLLSLEALSIKLPVLASNHPALLSQSKANKGIFTFENGKIKSLHNKIKALLSSQIENVEYNSLYEDGISKHKVLYNMMLSL